MGGSRRREDPPPCPPVNDNIAVLQPMRTNETHNQTSLITSPIEYSKVMEKHHTTKNRTPGGWGISMCLCADPTRTDLVCTFSWEIPVVGLWIYTLLDVFFSDFKSILIWATAKLYKVAFYVNRLKLVKIWVLGTWCTHGQKYPSVHDDLKYMSGNPQKNNLKQKKKNLSVIWQWPTCQILFLS